MTLNLSVDEVLTTTRSVRKRLDFDKPVPRDVLMECLELALQAPTGSNSQGWQWVFVEDAAKKKAIADVYLANARGYLSGPAPEYPDGDTRGERMGRVRDSATYLAEHMHRAPVLLIPCLKGREDESAVGGVSFWASLFPAVWSFCLALRSRGLGSCWTTLHLLDNGEHKVADVLGIPYDEYSQGGLLPIAYTQGIDFRPAKRLPAESVTHDVHQPRRRDRDGQRALHARGVGATPQARAHGAGAADPRPGPKRQRRNHRRRRTDGPPHPGGRRALARLPVNLCADSETGDATRRKRVVDFTLAASGGQPAQPVGVVHTRVGVIFSRVL